ncbi:LMBRL protein, partial [Dromaius novaehollandiae]|nr:LMBRL protein [Dromaius novaehollandiae]
ELRCRASAWQRSLGCPLATLCLRALTGLSVLVVCFHVLELLLDDAAMPGGAQVSGGVLGGAARHRGPGSAPDPPPSPQATPLGQVSFSALGSFGAALQVVLVLYLVLCSVVGFYSSPLFARLLPRRQDTPLPQIIGNCVSLLVLSSALPVFSRMLGITRFDLLGPFGHVGWLGNFYLVLLYNLAFAALAALCLLRGGLLRALGEGG